MNSIRWRMALGLGLVLVSALLFGLHYEIFHDVRQLGFYLLLDLVFVPLQVLLVTLFIDSLLAQREKILVLEKLNMAIGVFFSEVGTELLRRGLTFQPGASSLSGNLLISPAWSKAAYAGARKYVSTAAFKLESRSGDLDSLRSFLVARRAFLLGLLQNPVLLEHESFTELLWAVFHLVEELSARDALDTLSEPDLDHLSGDLQRAYRRLVMTWLEYMRHLHLNYPYLFSLAARLNPFDPAAQAQVRPAVLDAAEPAAHGLR